ncbi:MAG TPA: TldD/PmbA family protein [Ktedonobacterales bacterium]
MADLFEQTSELLAELEPRFPYVAAEFSGAGGVQISDNGREQDASEEPPSRGVVFTVYDGEAFHELATSDLGGDQTVREVRAWAAPLRAPGGRRYDASPTRFFAPEVQRDPGDVSLKEKLALVRDMQQRAQQLDSRIVQVQVRYRDRTQESVYLGQGKHLEQHVPHVIMQVLILTSDGNQVRYGVTQSGATGGFEHAAIGDEALLHTAEIAVRLLGAKAIEPGDYDTITDPSVSGTIAHESFGHGVEMDLFPKGRARAAHYFNERVAAPVVQMYDDPSVPGAYGSYFFDADGELAAPVQIIRDGVFVSPISDLSSATFASGPHTPNGRRQDFTRKTYARMSNTFFGKGDSDPAAMIASVDHGIYLHQAESGVEDPMGWGIQVTASYGEEIEHGRLTGRLFAPVAITGYVPELLRSVRMIGNDLVLEPGTCGKGFKEMVPVSVGGPHLLVRAHLG